MNMTVFSYQSNKSQSRQLHVRYLNTLWKKLFISISVECCKVLYLSIPISTHWDGEGACARILITMSTSTMTIARKKKSPFSKRIIKYTHQSGYFFFFWYKWIIINLDAFQSRDAWFFIRHSNRLSLSVVRALCGN